MASIPSKVSNLVAQKYQRGVNTFSRVVKSAPKDKIEIEIGDSKQPYFKPQRKIMRWDNECNISMRFPEDPNAVVETDGEVIKYKAPGYEVHQVERPEASEDGGHEIIAKFATLKALQDRTTVVNRDGIDYYRLVMTTQFKNVVGYKQLPLTQEYQDGFSEEFQTNITVTETEVKDEQGSVLVSRPRKIVNSIQFYHNSKGGMNRADGMEYKVGKLGGQDCIEIIGADGSRIWGDQNWIPESNELEILIPKDFVDNYDFGLGELVVDPTFGYQTNGASDLNICQLFFGAKTIRPKGSIFSASEAFTPTQISYYIKTLNNSAPTKAAIYDGSRNFIVETASSTTSGGDSWQDRSISGADSQLANNYWLIAIGDPDSFSSDPTFGPEIAYDSGDTNQGFLDTWSSYSFPATILASYSNDKYSIYATYTASGGEEVEAVTPMLSLLGVG